MKLRERILSLKTPQRGLYPGNIDKMANLNALKHGNHGYCINPAQSLTFCEFYGVRGKRSFRRREARAHVKALRLISPPGVSMGANEER